jgi:hypothetical protein
MKKALVFSLACLVIIGNPAAFSAPLKAGSSCSKINQFQQSSSTLLVCSASKGKKTWRKATSVEKSLYLQEKNRLALAAAQKILDDAKKAITPTSTATPISTPTPKPSASTTQRPNTTKPVVNLSLKSGTRKYTVTFDFQKDSGHYDVVVFESLTGQFSGEQYIVYVGTNKNIEVLTGGLTGYEPRWVLVRTRDQWSDLNISESKAGPVKPTSAEIDTSSPPCGIGQVCPGPALPPTPGPVLCRIGSAPWGKCS